MVQHTKICHRNPPYKQTEKYKKLLFALARTSRTILNRYGESGQPCLVPDFSGIAGSFSNLV